MRKSVLWLVLAVSACSTPVDPLTVEEVMQADRAFALDAAEYGLEGWQRWFTDDAVRYDASGMPLQGREELSTLDRPFWSDTTNTLVWEPAAGAVFDGGAVALTRGRWVILSVPQGDTLTSGFYSSLWRRTPNGPRVFFDAGEVDS